jgi:hypothetical protein
VLKRIATGDESCDETVPPESLPAVVGCRDHPTARFLPINGQYSEWNLKPRRDKDRHAEKFSGGKKVTTAAPQKKDNCR